MENQPGTPISIFLSWLKTIPAVQQQFLARMFILCTTSDSSDFAIAPEEALEKLEQYIGSPDFPLRRVSRLVILSAIFDLIVNNRVQLEAMDSQVSARGSGRKVAPLSEKQWEKTAASWRSLRKSELTDKIIFLWLQKCN